MNRWTLHVEDFGKIKEADIQIAPLTMFIGDNNSGKSYLMTMIYGLLNLNLYFDRYEYDKHSSAFQTCCRILEKITDGERIRANSLYHFLPGDVRAFQNLFNEVLDRNRNKFLTELFNRETPIKAINVRFSEETEFELSVTRNYNSEYKEENVIIFETEKGDLLTGASAKESDLRDGDGYWYLMTYIMEHLLRVGHRLKRRGSSAYLPVVRTGFLLTYKTLVGGAVEDKFNLRSAEKNLLTRPASDFLRTLSSMRTEKEELSYAECIAFIEDEILCGKIDVSQLPSHDFIYQPAGSETRLPMFASSGVVTEVTPLLLYLRFVQFDTLMIEEPEICLHPELQWRMMQALIRLQNMGIPVFITTHSDFMLQHVNNMIKANEMQQKELFLRENGYKKTDLLERGNTAVYQFGVETNSGYSIVSKLQCGDYGYELPTFYDTLRKMNREIDQIEGMEE